MVGVLLASLVLIGLGAVVALAGYVARRRGRPYGRYGIAVGGVLALLGLAGIALFVSAFG
ncbi:MAG: hypothetical protein ABEK02_01980 [Haloquadratum sp.]